MSDFYQEVKDWALGLKQNLFGDAIPPNSLSDAWDSAFVDLSEQGVKVGTRPRLRLSANMDTGVGHSVYGNYKHIHSYYHAATDLSFIHYLFMLNEVGGMVYKGIGPMATSGALPILTYPANDPISDVVFFPGTTSHVDSTNMNNRAFFASGEGQKRSVLGLNVRPFGIEPFNGAAEVEAGGTLLPAGTYDVGFTGYYDDIGAETSLGEVTTVTIAAGEKIKVTLSASASQLTQITHWTVYLREQSTQAVLYRVINPKDASGVAVTVDGRIEKATTTVYIDLPAVEIADQIIPAPTQTENNPPDPSMIYVATYGRRMIGASKRNIYWSKVDLPDAFPPENSEVVDTGEGDQIMGLFPFSNELLLIFTETAVFGLFGNDPQYWTLRPIDLTVGCVGHKSIVEYEQKVGWWSGSLGPVTFNGQQVERIGLKGFSQQFFTQPAITFNKHKIQGGWDPHHSTLIWAVPDPDDIQYTNTGGVNNYGDLVSNLVIPYNYRQQEWCASRWYPGAINCMTTAINERAEQRLFFINNYKNLFYFDDTSNYDADPDGFTMSGTFVPGSSSITTIAGTGMPTGLQSKWYGALVTVFDSSGQFVGRRMITSTNTTSMTLAKSLEVTSGATYTYYVGTPFFKIATPWFDLQQPFLRKRWDRLYGHFRMQDPAQAITVDIQLNSDSTGQSKTMTVTAESESAVVDATWDITPYTQTPQVKRRWSVAKNGHMLRIVVRQEKANPIVIEKLALMGRMLSDRYYR